MKRRHFVRNLSLTAAGLAVLPPSFGGAPTATKVRLGIIGVGLRGQNHLQNLLRRADVDIVSICDISPRMLEDSKALIQKSGKPQPKVYTGDPKAYRNLLAAKNIDGVLIATPWEWHTPMILDALSAGIKYIGTEVMLGITLEDHWQVVQAAESAGAQVMMLENVCYRRDVMAILNAVRQGMFGEIMHLQGGYQHDLRAVKFNNGKQPYGGGVEFGEKGFSEAAWRTAHSVHRNGDLYPTHGIGPLAEMIDINYGNRFVALSSFASKARGLHNYIVEKGGANHSNAKVEFKLGDVVTTQIRCAGGETILLQHDTNLPRPYSLGFRVQGTKGLWMDVNDSLYIEGLSKKEHEWEGAKSYLEKWDHPLWARWLKETENAGHGGMDFFVLHAFVEAVKRGVPTPMDVYDAAVWSAITPLSEMSIAMGNQTVEFPDFTSGQWMHRKNNFARNNEF
jgi:hypothetical protein